MDLPKIDKEGNPYLSPSSISCFLKSKKDFYTRYILGVPFEGNAFTEFGSQVGEALEHNSFDMFNEAEQKTLKKVKRLHHFEKEVKLQFDGFYLKGFIDSASKSFHHIIDYKTGGDNKEEQYYSEDYTQLAYYALALKQMTGKAIKKAEVHFIRRSGNPFKHIPLKVEGEVIVIDQDISKTRLDALYLRTIDIAKEIEAFYKQYK